jgi:superkiller protein 3
MRAKISGLVLVAAMLCAAPAHADELDLLAKAIDDRPEDPKSYDAYALAAFKVKRWDEAIRKLKQGVARIPEYGDGYYKLAYAYRQKQEWADAADYYRRYIVLNPSKTDPYFGLAASLQGLGDKKGAIAAYDKYVSLEKAPAKQRFVDQAKAELAKLDPSRAPAAQPAVNSTPSSPNALPPPAMPAAPSTPPVNEMAAGLKAQAEQLKKDGQLEEAAQAYRRAIEADRGNTDLYNELGNILFALKHYGEAAMAFRDATSRDPNFALGWYNLAHALRKADRKGEAVDAYRHYIKIRPDDPDPYYGLGQTLKALGDYPGAIDAFKKYISMERRPEEQKWVEKARAELQALEGTRGAPGGKVEEKSTLGTEQGQTSIVLEPYWWRNDTLLDPFPETGRSIEPYALLPFSSGDPDALMNPFAAEQIADDPVGGDTETRRRLRSYGQALAAYRRALNRHVESVAAVFERGIAHALADDRLGATRNWNAIELRDTALEQARREVERVRVNFQR